MKKLVVSGLAALSLAAAVMPENEAGADGRLVLQFGTAVPVECSNPGSSQDVGKTPVLKNTTGATMKKDFLVSWSSSDGDHNQLRLEADLPPGGTVKALGAAGNAYTCTARFFSEPDLTVKAATWQGASSVKVDVQNLDSWIASKPSVVRLEVLACSGEVLHSYDSAPLTFAKGETKSISFPTAYPGGNTYLRVTADAKSAVLERNEKNNVLDGIGTCVH
jgi:hypothetical protein